MHNVKRHVRNKDYFFIEKSVRLPDNSVRKISCFIGANKKKMSDSSLKHFFLEKEKQLFAKWAVKNYTFDYPLTEPDIERIEGIKVEYKHLLRELWDEDISDMLDRITVNFTYETNAIEGSSLTLKDVAVVIFQKECLAGKSLREIYEARNHRRIMDLLFARKIKINHEWIIRVHKLFMLDIEQRAGYKTLPNFVLGSSLKTSAPERVYQDMTDLINWYNVQSKKMHPLQCAALFHGKFLQIHPFADGNGRVARVLLNAMLVNKGYPPIIIRKTQRTAYLHALRAYDKKSQIQLVRFITEKYKHTFEKFFKVYLQYI